VSENSVLKRIFGPKREEVVGDWRRLHKELRCTKHYYGDQIKDNEMDKACSMHGRPEKCI
jgi:hypothetical protein